MMMDSVIETIDCFVFNNLFFKAHKVATLYK
jgi:hypothetical protein